MLRSSGKRLIVPPHGLIPGRAVERGFLHRSSRQNMYCRLANMTRGQRTSEEELKFMFTMIPDPMRLFSILVPFIWVTWWLSSYTSPNAASTHKNRQFAGALNQGERFHRNAQMSQVFASHRAVLEEMRLAAGIEAQEEIFLPPAGSMYH